MIRFMVRERGVRGVDTWRRNIGAWMREHAEVVPAFLAWVVCNRKKLDGEFESEIAEHLEFENREAWKGFYAKAEQWIDSTRPDLDPLEREIHVVQMAERFAVENLYKPPHWTGSTHCDSCGYMPSLPSEIECQWCEVMP